MFAIMVAKENLGIWGLLDGNIWHSASLGTESPYQTTTQQFFLFPPGTEKLNKSAPGNSNIFQMFNNNIYTDFRTPTNML